jgi:DHA1 family tetracycline resistance protein-like MFS transporter
MLGVGVLIPVIPQLLGNPESTYYLLGQGSEKLGFILLGVLTASYPIAQFFAAPVLGALSDKYGRRPVLLLSILGTALSYFVFAWAIIIKNIPLLIFSRIVDGITGGNITVAQAAITDSTTPTSRSKVFGMIGAAFGLGFIFGPFIGGKLADPGLVSWFSAATPFFFSGVLAIINLTLLFFYFKETNEHIDPERTIDYLGSTKNIVRASHLGKVKILLLVSFLFNAGFAFFGSFFNVYLSHKFNLDAGAIGNFFGYIGVCIVLTQLIVVRLTAARWHNAQILRIAYVWTGIALLLYLLPTKVWQFYLIVPFFAIPNGLQNANFNAFLTKHIEPKRRGEILGLSSSVNSLGQAVPPLFAGIIAAVFASWVPILIAALFVLSAGVAFRRAVPKGVSEDFILT